MFNKIITSVVSSVVMFACNVKEDAPAAVADVLAGPTPQSSTAAQDSPVVTPTAPAPVATNAPSQTSTTPVVDVSTTSPTCPGCANSNMTSSGATVDGTAGATVSTPVAPGAVIAPATVK